MTLSERAKYYYIDENMNCAVSILLAGSDIYNLGITKDDARLLVGFGGGLGCGNLCGALAGAIAVLGKALLPEGTMRSPEFTDWCAEFTAAFNEKWGNTMCATLKPEYAVPELRCAKLVLGTADMLQEFIDKVLAEKED